MIVAFGSPVNDFVALMVTAFSNLDIRSRPKAGQTVGKVRVWAFKEGTCRNVARGIRSSLILGLD
jgi:hypothetical protein